MALVLSERPWAACAHSDVTAGAGYTALCAATSLKSWCPGLVLCNSAGRMLPRAEWELEKEELYKGAGLRAQMLGQVRSYLSPVTAGSLMRPLL
jgi:hypothetical protein